MTVASHPETASRHSSALANDMALQVRAHRNGVISEVSMGAPDLRHWECSHDARVEIVDAYIDPVGTRQFLTGFGQPGAFSPAIRHLVRVPCRPDLQARSSRRRR